MLRFRSHIVFRPVQLVGRPTGGRADRFRRSSRTLTLSAVPDDGFAYRQQCNRKFTYVITADYRVCHRWRGQLFVCMSFANALVNCSAVGAMRKTVMKKAATQSLHVRVQIPAGHRPSKSKWIHFMNKEILVM